MESHSNDTVTNQIVQSATDVVEGPRAVLRAPLVTSEISPTSDPSEATEELRIEPPKSLTVNSYSLPVRKINLEGIPENGENRWSQACCNAKILELTGVYLPSTKCRCRELFLLRQTVKEPEEPVKPLTPIEQIKQTLQSARILQKDPSFHTIPLLEAQAKSSCSCDSSDESGLGTSVTTGFNSDSGISQYSDTLDNSPPMSPSVSKRRQKGPTEQHSKSDSEQHNSVLLSQPSCSYATSGSQGSAMDNLSGNISAAISKVSRKLSTSSLNRKRPTSLELSSPELKSGGKGRSGSSAASSQLSTLKTSLDDNGKLINPLVPKYSICTKCRNSLTERLSDAQTKPSKRNTSPITLPPGFSLPYTRLQT